MQIDLKNSTQEIISFATKAETLSKLKDLLREANILDYYYFNVLDWKTNRTNILAELTKLNWFICPLVVRSSAKDEDTTDNSLAGKYISLVNVCGLSAIEDAVDKVISSYSSINFENQVLIQPYLQNVILSGVAFGCEPNTGAPYTVINYDDKTNDTTSVTSGASNHKCYVHHNSRANKYAPKRLQRILALMLELKNLFGTEHIDVEFAITENHELYLFQVRKLTFVKSSCLTLIEHKKALHRIEKFVAGNFKAHPYLYGAQTVYGVMPDWNPAEIIGIRPKPLAISLYKELVTNSVWAYQRDNYGYMNLRSFPLLVEFEGLPYIDVRVSFNSFIPKDLSADLAEKLVNYYLERLICSPALHDKVEFDIVFSCYTPNLYERLLVLKQYGFSLKEINKIFQSLLSLTNNILHKEQGFWRSDLEKISELIKRQDLILNSDLNLIEKMYWLLEDCKRYGTLPFAGLARAGFIAVQILKSFTDIGILDDDKYSKFINSINSVSSQMNHDFIKLTKDNFLKKYGHLRPGTYDILSKRYDEAPDEYFDWNNQKHEINDSKFSLNLEQLRAIQTSIEKDGVESNVLDLLEFIKIAIESREYSKFIFSKSISNFLKLCEEFCNQYDITRKDAPYLDVSAIYRAYSSSVDIRELLKQSIENGKKRYESTCAINLPPLITHPEQVWSFELADTEPNFITQKNVVADVDLLNNPHVNIIGKIVMIPNADPGFDWLFSHKIAGFITQYGGANSHMAIRAGEMNIPAIIGAGEVKYNLWSKARKLYLDCLNKQVEIL